LSLPSIRVGERGFRSFWTIRPTSTIDSRVSPIAKSCLRSHAWAY